MRLLGLTGDIAAGKSTVAALLKNQYGAAAIDADALVHELYADPSFAARLVAALTDFRGADADAIDTVSLLDGSGAIDRRALGALVFNNARALRQLEAIVHPAVVALRETKLRELSARAPLPNVVVLEAVKLIESGQAAGCEIVWCVRAAPVVQLGRLMENRGLDPIAAQARLDNQPPFAAKKELLAALPDAPPLVEIWNNGTPAELEAAIASAWRHFASRSDEEEGHKVL